jgi:hypothetical protein
MALIQEKAKLVPLARRRPIELPLDNRHELLDSSVPSVKWRAETNAT